MSIIELNWCEWWFYFKSATFIMFFSILIIWIVEQLKDEE
jgi:hypothetical protein